MRTSEGRLRLGWRLTLFVAITMVVMVLVGLVMPAGLLTGSFGLLGGALLAGVTLLALDGRAPGALGFFLGPRAASESLLGLALGTSVALLVVVVLFAMGGVGWAAQDGTALGWLTGALGALAFLAIPAAAEEALLRGYPLQALAEAWGPLGALAATAVVFGALHLSNPGVTVVGTVNVAVAGIFLGIVYLRTGSLWWATGAHLGWNWAHGYLADVPVSGLELLDAPLYEGSMTGPDWIGGGSFGPEGSLVATVLLGLVSVWCWRTAWLRPSEAAIATRPLAILGERSA
ncbi:MAG: CPBP family intramembrane metalloprotease [Gemmatimonadota bacterium]